MLSLQCWFLVLSTWAFCSPSRQFDVSGVPSQSTSNHPLHDTTPLLFLYAEARKIVEQISHLNCELIVLRGLVEPHQPSLMLEIIEMLIRGPILASEPLAPLNALRDEPFKRQWAHSFIHHHKILLTALQTDRDSLHESISIQYSIPKPTRLGIFDILLLLSYKDPAADALLQITLGPLASSLASSGGSLSAFYPHLESWEQCVKMFFHELYNLNVLHNKAKHVRKLLEFTLSDGVAPREAQLELIFGNLARLRPLAEDKLLETSMGKIMRALKRLVPDGFDLENSTHVYQVIVSLRHRLLHAMLSLQNAVSKLRRRFLLSLSSHPTVTELLQMIQGVSPIAWNILVIHDLFVLERNLPNLLEVDVFIHLPRNHPHFPLYQFTTFQPFMNPVYKERLATIPTNIDFAA